MHTSLKMSSTTTPPEKEERVSQEKLSTVIKSIHTALRKQCLKGADPDHVWSKHKDNQSVLAEYATAMKDLATKHWQKAKETRIDWIHKFIISYYSANGLLHRLMDKDKRTLEYHTECQPEKGEEKEGNVDPHLRCCRSVFDCEEQVQKHREEVKKLIGTRQGQNTIQLPINDNIRVIDVGSCYAPLKEYSHLDCLSIDLHPATQDVLQCDFLDVHTHTTTTTTTSEQSSPVAIMDTSDCQKIHSLPERSYHSVVFSLLLEYMPSVQQRWKCCLKAHKVLLLNGILVIVTPDSNKEHRRAQQMKDWKEAIESMGFQRCFYEKKEHLHCMAFRKITDNTSEGISDTLEAKMYIPQDFNTEVSSESSDVEHSPQTKRKKLQT